MNDAIGIIEMFGFVTAITAADAAAKAADVKVIAIDSNKPANADSVEVPLIMAVKVQGSVSAVTAAVDAAARTAESISGLINKHIIARPTDALPATSDEGAFDLATLSTIAASS